MNTATRKGRSKSIATAAASALAVVVALSACGAPGADGGAPAEGASSLTIPLVFDATGAAGPFASEALRGAQLAITEVNEAGGIDGTLIEPVVTDSGSDPQQAAAAMNRAVRDNAPVVLYGSGSNMALAMAPIAQQASTPLIAVQSGAPGLLENGEYVYRSTPQQVLFHELQAQYLAEQGVERVAVLYNSDNETYNELGSEGYAAFGEEYGFSVESEGIMTADSDVSTVTSLLLESEPDAFVMLLQSNNNTVPERLRQLGFEGIIAGSISIGVPTLTAMGDLANGIVWPDTFAYDIECESGSAFVEAYEAEYGELPGSLGASGYDGARMMIEGMRNAPSLDAEGIQQGLQTVLESGFDEAATCEVWFDEERNPHSPARLLQWQDGAFSTIATE
ncbi:ABC transporter substrate-binding protein [Agrococcus baldri]|uniref:Branched-chain amino acid ABC transporter substrate-binding protein n=1 Tax=Agrococcus baldri TaxID=153730 RepID=A0AA87UQL3_9MICO|nr:ABC transporter substrate-binding protein [Agrococcus baldri]GEK79111.1 branched-chain amino acid ABC transporter substrate-binding protein [Agrococcus baldri]